MINNDTVAQIKRHLLSRTQDQSEASEQRFSPDYSPDQRYVYAVIDGASCPQLRFKLYDWAPESCCLWSGKLEPDLEEVAPYLVKLNRDSLFTDWLIREGWDNHWNIFVESELDFKALRKQIRKLLLVKSAEGETMVFRFYDPRVMALFAPTSDVEQAVELYENLTSISYQQEDELISAYFSEVNQQVEFNKMV